MARRRRRSIIGLRNYSVHATTTRQNKEAGDVDGDAASAEEVLANQIRARSELDALLQGENDAEYSRAWELYVEAGYPNDMNVRLLGYLSNSVRIEDRKRARQLFDECPKTERSEEDYLHITKYLLRSGDFDEAIRVCKEAFASGSVTTWARMFAYFANNKEWYYMLEAWRSLPRRLENRILFSCLEPSLLVKQASDFATFLRANDELRTPGGLYLATNLLNFVMSFPSIVKRTSTQATLHLLREYNNLGILDGKIYYRLIGTLRSSKRRSIAVRSLLVYRNLRWRLPAEVPPVKVIEGLVKTLASFEAVKGVQYLLDESYRFCSTPTVRTYIYALTAFSRAGSVEAVHKVLDRIMSDPKGPGRLILVKLMKPLIYVHARIGDVNGALTQFRRMTDEFGCEADIECYNVLIGAYTGARDFFGALSIFKEMLSRNVQPDDYSFSTLMAHCAKRGDIEGVRNLIRMARERKIPMTIPMLASVVEAYCKNHRLDMAESVAESALDVNAKGARVRMWNMLLWNYAFRLELDSFSRIRTRMRDIGLQPDGFTYAALMLCLVLTGYPDSARRVLRTLHRTGRIEATRFHYDIILSGYLRSRNRDMVHVIFREMEERFGNPGIGSRVLDLRNEIGRDLDLARETGYRTNEADFDPTGDDFDLAEETGLGSDNAPASLPPVRLAHAENRLSDTVSRFDVSILASEGPFIESRSQPLGEAFPAVFYEHIIRAYGNRGAIGKVEALFKDYLGARPSPIPSAHPYDLTPSRLLTTLMNTYVKARRHDEVDIIWKTLFRRSVKDSRQSNIASWLSSGGEAMPAMDEALPILPSQRFILSWPISLYMRSIADRGEFLKLREVVKQVEDAGFSLTSFNWAVYVERLCHSDSMSGIFEAFSVYEKTFMPCFPSWGALRRGSVLRPPDVSEYLVFMDGVRLRQRHQGFLGKKGRFHLAKIRPGSIVPTYTTAIHVASAYRFIKDRSVVYGDGELRDLYAIAPQTIDALGLLPFSKDKLQRTLLRGRSYDRGGRPGNRKSYSPFVWTGGVLGVGGQPRIRPSRASRQVEAYLHDVQKIREAQLSEAEAESQRHVDTAQGEDAQEQDTLPPPESERLPFEAPPDIFDRQDAYDIEAETLLENSGAENDTEMDDADLVIAEAEEARRMELDRQEMMEQEERRIRKEEEKAAAAAYAKAVSKMGWNGREEYELEEYGQEKYEEKEEDR